MKNKRCCKKNWWFIIPILVVLWIYVINISLKLISTPSNIQLLVGVAILSLLAFITYKIIKYINKYINK